MPTAVEIQDATRKAVVKGVVFYAVLMAALFGSSGDWRWFGGWLLVALFTVFQVQAFRQMTRQPDLLVERSKLQPGTKSWDKVLVALIALVFPLLTWITAALDHRFGWAARGPSWWMAAGVALVIAGGYLMQRAIAANPFFSGTVRIQDDRGQTVVSTGPYAYVRHPGYVGLLAFTVGTPLILGSRWALLPATLGAILLLIRTALEDRTLQVELSGYAEYAQRVRSRLIPFLW